MKTIGAAIASLVALLALGFIIIVQPGPSGVVASLRLPDGSEYLVTQRCNWSAEPYTVSFYMKPAGGRWGWCYLDHEASRWFDVALTFDPASDTIAVTERGSLQATLNRSRSVFQRVSIVPPLDIPAPQEFRDPEFAMP